LDTKYCTTIFFYPRTNKKIENFNSLIGNIFTKLLINKSTKLWNLYLDTAIFAVQIRQYINTEYSFYYLVYRIYFCISDNNNSVVFSPIADRTEKLEILLNIQIKINKLLFNYTIRMNCIYNSLVTKISFQKNIWVLIQNKNRKKFKYK